MKYAVVTTHTFTEETTVCLFKTEQEAIEYLRALWENAVQEEQQNNNPLDTKKCFLGETYASIKYADGESTYYNMTVVSDPIVFD